MSALFGYFMGLLVGVLIMLLMFHGAVKIGCETDGATVLHKITRDHKYLTYYCVKNGKVVP